MAPNPPSLPNRTEEKKGKYKKIDKTILRYAISMYGPKSGTLEQRLRVALSAMGLSAPPSGTPYWRQSAVLAIAGKFPDLARRAEGVVSRRQQSKAAKRRKQKLYREGAYQAPKVPAPQPAPHEALLASFYSSWEWARLRYDFLKGRQRRCECCGATPEDGVRIVVDHIKPIRHHWHLRLDGANLQMLCDPCNMGKGSRDETDWRNVVPMLDSVLISKSVSAGD